MAYSWYLAMQLSVAALLVFFCSGISKGQKCVQSPKTQIKSGLYEVWNLNNQAAVKIKSSNPYFCDLNLALIQVLNLNLLCLPTCDDSYQLNTTEGES